MRFAEIENIWTVDLQALSMADRGRLYYERAKHVVSQAMADRARHPDAFEGRRFSRSYLTDKIGSQPAVTTQNPRIKDLLRDTDRQLAADVEGAVRSDRVVPGRDSAELGEMQKVINMLRRRLEITETENVELRRQVKAAGWIAADDGALGTLPW